MLEVRKTLTNRILDWIQNNKVLSSLIVLGIIIISVAKFLISINDIIENIEKIRNKVIANSNSSLKTDTNHNIESTPYSSKREDRQNPHLVETSEQKTTKETPKIKEPDQTIVKEKSTVEQSKPKNLVEDPITSAEEMPSYPELYTFISNNIQYPEIAKRAGIEGRVHVSLIVEKDGSISDIKIQKGIGAGCDEEAIRVIRLMGKWKPGILNGRPTRVKIIVPILFKLQ